MTPTVQGRYAAEMSPRSTRDPSVVEVRIRDAGFATGEGSGDIEGGRLMGKLAVDVEDPAVPYDITMTVVALHGQLACEEITIGRRDRSPAVTGTVLRSTLIDTYLTRIRQELAQDTGQLFVMTRVRSTPESSTYRGMTDAERDGLAQSPRRRRRASVDLAEVAKLYREAAKTTHAPTAEVAKQLGIHRGYAGALVSRARKEGHLGPARPGRGGEEDPR